MTNETSDRLREAAQALIDWIGPKDMRVYATDRPVRDLVAALSHPTPAFDAAAVREACAVALWKREAERAAPNVAKGRNAKAFHDQNEPDKAKWLDLADTAIRALDDHEPTSKTVDDSGEAVGCQQEAVADPLDPAFGGKHLRITDDAISDVWEAMNKVDTPGEPATLTERSEPGASGMRLLLGCGSGGGCRFGSVGAGRQQAGTVLIRQI